MTSGARLTGIALALGAAVALLLPAGAGARELAVVARHVRRRPALRDLHRPARPREPRGGDDRPPRRRAPGRRRGEAARPSALAADRRWARRRLHGARGRGRSRRSSSPPRHRDIVLVDQRGTGKSKPLFCPAAGPSRCVEPGSDPRLLDILPRRGGRRPAAPHDRGRDGRPRRPPRRPRLPTAEPLRRLLRRDRGAVLPPPPRRPRPHRDPRRRHAPRHPDLRALRGRRAGDAEPPLRPLQRPTRRAPRPSPPPPATSARSSRVSTGSPRRSRGRP